MNKVLVTGAGGFIGSHLVSFLRKRDYWVRGVDITYPEFSTTDAHEFQILDLRRVAELVEGDAAGIDEVSCALRGRLWVAWVYIEPSCRDLAQ